jgi:hypothetical protein
MRKIKEMSTLTVFDYGLTGPLCSIFWLYRSIIAFIKKEKLSRTSALTTVLAFAKNRRKAQPLAVSLNRQSVKRIQTTRICII